MTATERRQEWKYRYDERLGMMCEDREPTARQKQIAAAEATQACAEIQKQDETEGQC